MSPEDDDIHARLLPVDVGDGMLPVFTTGSGPALLMIHGWPLDHRIFKPQRDGLSDALQIITYDRRGFGQASAPPDMRREADDIIRILNALDIDTAHVLGMSQGGRVATRFAARHSIRLKTLMLQGAIIDDFEFEEPPEEKVPVSWYARLARSHRLAEVIAHWKQHPMMQLPADEAGAIALIDDILADYRGNDLVSFTPEHYQSDTDVRAALSRLTAPSLLLTGPHDTAARQACAQELLSLIPDCREIRFTDGGHLNNLTHSDAYNTAVREFVLAHDAPVVRSATHP